MADLTGICDICGKSSSIITCPLCGARTCINCSGSGMCVNCRTGKK